MLECVCVIGSVLVADDLNPDLFFHHRFPMIVFAVFILFSFLAIIVMLNLCAAHTDPPRLV